MSTQRPLGNRRHWLQATSGFCLGGLSLSTPCQILPADAGANSQKASIAISLDLEMSRNFPRREDTHWDFEKGNLDEAAKKYSVAVARRVKKHGGRVHCFCVGRVLEQPDVTWLQEIAEEGHPIGNHTYDHVNVLAQSGQELQFRFQRSPWLIEGRSLSALIQENIRLTTLALKQRIKMDNRGFRTPGGFTTGLNDREDLQQMLLDLGFKWVSSLYPSHANTDPGVEPNEAVYRSIVEAQLKAQPFVYPTGLVEIPMSPISDIGAFRTGQWKLEWFLEAVRLAIGWTIDNQATFDFLAHPSCLGVVDPEFRTIDLICELVSAAGGAAELVDLDQIAALTQ